MHCAEFVFHFNLEIILSFSQRLAPETLQRPEYSVVSHASTFSYEPGFFSCLFFSVCFDPGFKKENSAGICSGFGQLSFIKAAALCHLRVSALVCLLRDEPRGSFVSSRRANSYRNCVHSLNFVRMRLFHLSHCSHEILIRALVCPSAL